MISGYTVSVISYTLEAESLDTVSFALAPAGATTAQSRLAPAAPWTSCTLTGGVASCPIGTPVSAASVLEVVAAG